MKLTDPKSEQHLVHEGIVARLWPEDWAQVANVESSAAKERRRRLRMRAQEWLDVACVTARPDQQRPIASVSKPESVSLATEGDSFGLLVLIQESDKELAITTRDYGKVREVIDMATDRTPVMDADGTPFMRPVFGVIVADGVVEAACGMFPTQPWDSWETYLRGFFLYVGLANRNGRPGSEYRHHAKHLLEWSNWFACRSHMAIVWEVLNCRPLDDRSRLFMRHASPLGGFFIHRPVEVAA